MKSLLLSCPRFSLTQLVNVKPCPWPQVMMAPWVRQSPSRPPGVGRGVGREGEEAATAPKAGESQSCSYPGRKLSPRRGAWLRALTLLTEPSGLPFAARRFRDPQIPDFSRRELPRNPATALEGRSVSPDLGLLITGAPLSSLDDLPHMPWLLPEPPSQELDSEPQPSSMVFTR